MSETLLKQLVNQIEELKEEVKLSRVQASQDRDAWREFMFHSKEDRRQIRITVDELRKEVAPMLEAWHRWRGAKWGLTITVGLIGTLFALVMGVSALVEKFRIIMGDPK